MGRMENMKLSKNTNVAQDKRMEAEKDREGMLRGILPKVGAIPMGIGCLEQVPQPDARPDSQL
jgi:hypothetical protein